MEDWEESASPQSLVDAIDREGADFGLCGFVDEDMGRVFVCDVALAPEAYNGLGDCSREGVGRRLMSVDDETPYDAVYDLRIPQTDDPSAPFKAFDAALEKKKKTASDDMLHEFKSVMARKLRGGALYYPGMNDMLALNRKQRRTIEAEIKRRGR